MEIQFLIPVLRGLCLPTFITRTLRSRFIVYRKKTFPNVNQWKRRCFLSAQELQAVGQVTQTENL